FPAPGGRHAPSRFITRFLLILSAAFISVAQAQAPPDDDDDDPPAAMPAPERLGMERINLDQWLFDGQGNYAGARQRLNSMLAFHVEDIDRVCKLTEAQKTKLRLLGRGDINRFFDCYEKLKQK